MKFRNIFAAAGLLTLGLLPSAANAVVVNAITDQQAAFAAVNIGDTLELGDGVWLGTPPAIRAGNSSGTRSPFDGSGTNGGPPADWDEIDYWSVGPSNNTTLATLDFGGVDQTQFSLLWGSLDNYNSLKFYNDGSLVAEILAANIPNSPDMRVGASYVTISDLIFDQVKFGSTSNAFEFSNISSTAVPIPAPLALFLTGLAGLGFIARRRKV